MAKNNTTKMPMEFCSSGFICMAEKYHLYGEMIVTHQWLKAKGRLLKSQPFIGRGNLSIQVFILVD